MKSSALILLNVEQPETMKQIATVNLSDCSGNGVVRTGQRASGARDHAAVEGNLRVGSAIQEKSENK